MKNFQRVPEIFEGSFRLLIAGAFALSSAFHYRGIRTIPIFEDVVFGFSLLLLLVSVSPMLV
jgi:hypothetical protein